MTDYLFIDADDTLWENERYFRDAEKQFAALLAPNADFEDIQHSLWRNQEENIPYFGYGSKTYLIGMTDAAMELCGGCLPSDTYLKIKKIIMDLAFHDVELFDGVEETLEELSHRRRLVLATKGDASEQLWKVRKSGVMKYFVGCEVMQKKDPEDYLEVARKYGVAPEDFVMVGNSVRSDIVPVLEIGARAVFIPHEIVWVHELADMPQSDRVTKIESFKDLMKFL